MENINIIKHDEIKAIADRFINLYRLATELHSLLNTCKNEDSKYHTYFFNSINNNFGDRHIDNCPYFRIKFGFIGEILKCNQLNKVLTNEERKKMNEAMTSLANAKEFVISETSAHDILISFFNNADEIIKNQVKSCFLLLTNNRNYANKIHSKNADFKNQDSFKIGNKVKICGINKNKIDDIIKCFNLITNQQLISEYFSIETYYRNTIHDRTDYTKKYNCAYFTLKLFKNGNAHIEFTDFQALEKFNLMVGKYFNYLRS